MKIRILTAAVLVPFLLLTLFVLPIWVMTVVLSLICALGVYELLFSTGLVRHTRLLIYSAITAVVVPFWCYFDGNEHFMLGIILLFISVMFMEIMIGRLTVAFDKLCLCFFGKEVAAIALTVMLISDSAAALVGRSVGKIKIYKNKTLEGTLAFFVSAVVINLLFWPLYPFTAGSIVACLVATLAEVYEDKIEIDDNLSVPVFFSVVLNFF